MGFLRRLLGSSDDRTPSAEPAPTSAESAADDAIGAPEAAEQAYEHELLRAEHERLDELRQRQLRYADYAWQPPAEGGTRRADDGDSDHE